MKQANPRFSRGASKSRHLDQLLDEALKGTFPASDPVAIALEQPLEKRDTPDQANSKPSRRRDIL